MQRVQNDLIILFGDLLHDSSSQVLAAGCGKCNVHVIYVKEDMFEIQKTTVTSI